MLAGGTLAPQALASLNGPAFAAAAPALALLLLAGCLQHLGWQCSHALLAMRRDTAYAHSLGWPAWLQFGNLALLPLVLPPDPALGGDPRRRGGHGGPGRLRVALSRPDATACGACATTSGSCPLTAIAAATGAATPCRSAICRSRERCCCPCSSLGGAAAFALRLWRFELRGRWRQARRRSRDRQRLRRLTGRTQPTCGNRRY
jgi:hypothetical protein